MPCPISKFDPEKLRRIRLLVLDVDGVMTDGSITYSSAGEEIKSFNVLDGSGLKYWHRSGGVTAIVTGRESSVVLRRAKELDINLVRTGAKDKLPALQELLAECGMPLSEAAAMGDDLPDIPVMRKAGLAIAVPNAVPEVKDLAPAMTEKAGGQGAVREAIEAILKAQGKWDAILSRYWKD